MQPVRVLAIAGALLASTVASAQERLYLANDDHTDYFWALDDAGYRQAFQDMIGFYLDQAESSAGNDVNARGRFNLDGALWVYEWEHNQPAAQMDRLMAHVAAGDISLQLHSLVLLGGAMPTEAVIRDMMYAGRLERRYPVHVDMAVMMENQTLAGGLASLWAGAGAKYSWRGICDCATALASPGDRDREIYTFAGHDGQGVLMKWNSLVSNNQSIGGYAEAFDPAGAVDVMEHNAGYRARMPFPVKAAFGFGWDAPQTETDAFITAAQTLGDDAHEIIVSNEHDFFEDFSASVNVATDVPLFVGSHGNEWDLLTASLATPSGQMRRTMAKLRQAEGLAVIVGNADPSFLAGRFDGTDEDRELAQLHMGMFYDHDWTADSPLHDARAQFQRDTAEQVRAYVDGLASDAVARLGQLVPAVVPAVPGHLRFVVANPIASFVPAVVELPGITSTFRAFDVGQGFDLPTQLSTDESGAVHALITVTGPAVGYTIVDVTLGPPDTEQFPDLCQVDEVGDGALSFTDTHMVVRVERAGQISSLVNTHDNSELAGAGLFTFHDDSALGTTVALLENGSVRCRVGVDVPSAPGIPAHSVVYTLAGLDRLDVTETIHDNFGDTEGYGIDLSSLPGVQVHHEETGMLALATRVSHGGDYADDDACTDFLTLNDFVDVGNPTFGFTIASVESQFMKVGQSDVNTLDENPRSLFLVAGMQLDPALGFADQGGDTELVDHFAVLPRDFEFDGIQSMFNAIEVQTDLVAVPASGPADAPLQASLEKLVFVVGAAPWWVKPAEDGASSGTIVRMWNTSQNAFTTFVRGSITSAARTNHLENDNAALPDTPIDDHGVNVALAIDEIATLRVFLAPPAAEGEGEGSASEGEGTASEGEGEGAASEGEGTSDAGPAKALAPSCTCAAEGTRALPSSRAPSSPSWPSAPASIALTVLVCIIGKRARA